MILFFSMYDHECHKNIVFLVFAIFTELEHDDVAKYVRQVIGIADLQKKVINSSKSDILNVHLIVWTGINILL